MTLRHLISEAVALAGGNTCASGHDWGTDGGRSCPHGAIQCSQTVYKCVRCGEYDYGEAGGPGHDDCLRGCSEDAKEILADRSSRYDRRNDP